MFELEASKRRWEGATDGLASHATRKEGVQRTFTFTLQELCYVSHFAQLHIFPAHLHQTPDIRLISSKSTPTIPTSSPILNLRYTHKPAHPPRPTTKPITMAQLNPQYLTEALSNFLQAAQTKAQAQAQTQAEAEAEAAHNQNHDPQAISRLEQENEALRDALAALQDRIDNGIAALGKEADEMQERLGTAEDSIVELTEHACQLGESVGGLEAAVRGGGELMYR